MNRPPPRLGHPTDVVDAGLQSERTYLAWQRTGLSFAALGALLVHVAGGVGRPVAAIPGLVGLAVGAVILLRALVRYRVIVAAARGQGTASSAPLVAAVSGITALLGLGGMAVILAV